MARTETGAGSGSLTPAQEALLAALEALSDSAVDEAMAKQAGVFTNKTVVIPDLAQTLTNKVIDADTNTIQDLVTTNFKTGVIDTDNTLSADSDSVLATQKATKAYVDNLSAGLSWKDSAAAASTANVDISTGLENGDTIDGVTLSTGDRVLLKDQTVSSENGIYVAVASGAASRSTDMDDSAEFNNATVSVDGGTANQGITYRCNAIDPVVDTDPITFSIFGAAVQDASTTQKGVVELATQVETEAKTDPSLAVTPAGLQSFVTNNTSATAGGQLATSDGTGKIVKFDSTTNGLVKLTAGVVSTAVNGADYYAPGAIVAIEDGGTGINASGVTNGQIFIGSTVTGDFALAGITGTTNNITVANGDHSITLSLPTNVYSEIFGADATTHMDFSVANQITFVANSVNRLRVESDGTISIVDTVDYENLVTADDDIPNKKYVDDLVTSMVNGPASSTDNALTRFDGTTGKLVQNSGVTLDDNDNMVIASGSLSTTSADASGAYTSVQATATSTNFYQHYKFTSDGSDNYLYVSDGTTPNGNLSGNAGDICLNGPSGQILYCEGTTVWSANAGGDVTGPASSTDNAIARYDSTTGKIIQNSGFTIDDEDTLATENGTIEVTSTDLIVTEGNLITGDQTNNTISIYDGITSSITTTFSSPATSICGLTYADGDLLSCDSGTDKIYVHDGITSIVTTSFSTPGTSPQDLGFDGSNVISSDSGNDKIYVHSGITSTITTSFASPNTFIRGLTVAGSNLVSGDVVADKIYVHDAITAVITTSFASPSGNISGLGYDGINLLSGDFGANKIYVHSGTTSTITDSFTSSHTSTYGLTVEPTVTTPKIPYSSTQSAQESTNFSPHLDLNGINVYTSDGTTPNGNLTGTAGDLCLNGPSGSLFKCTTGTTWVDMGLGGTGTVTSVDSGDGMDFTSVTATGDVTLGTPTTLTTSTTNAVTATSHTHALSGVAASGANSDITSLTGLTTELSQSQGGTGVDTSAATNGQVLVGGTTSNDLQLATITGGTGVTVTNGVNSIEIEADNNGTVTGVAAGSGMDFGTFTDSGSVTMGTPTTLTTSTTNGVTPTSHTHAITGVAASGANSDITSLTGLTTPLSQSQGGTGLDTSSAIDGQVLIGGTSSNDLQLATITGGAGITVSNGTNSIEIGSDNNGTVTSVAAGNGMDFTTFTDSGSAVMGTPSSITDSSTNSVTATSHTHAVDEASTIQKGIIEIANSAEVDTGTDVTRAVTPGTLADSYAATKSVQVVTIEATTDIETGDNKAYFYIPAALSGMNLVSARGFVETAGTTNATTIQVYNSTDAVDMLSSAISIASASTSGTGTVDTANDDVATNDRIQFDIDTVSTTAPKGLTIVLEFRLP